VGLRGTVGRLDYRTCAVNLTAPSGKPNIRSPLTIVSRATRLGGSMQELVRILQSEEGQDIAEYAVMLAVILVLVVGTIRLVGSNANNVFSQVGSSLNQ
jgi:Flp pilus assembly pilin Flp